MSDQDELVSALAPVARTLEQLGVRYYVGGSVASSFHGASRSTMDVDLVCELQDSDVADFIKLVGNDFYISEVAVRDAIQRQSCFNLIHYPTSFKVDVFVSKGRPFDQETLARATVQTLGKETTVSVPIASAEDIIVVKLEWFRLTDEASERQWNDVSRLVALLGNSIDLGRLRQAGQSIGVADLVERLIRTLET